MVELLERCLKYSGDVREAIDPTCDCWSCDARRLLQRLSNHPDKEPGC